MLEPELPDVAAEAAFHPAAGSARLEIDTEPGLQALCRVLGALSLYDLTLHRGAFRHTVAGLVHVTLDLESPPEVVERLVKRLENLVDVHAVRRARRAR